MALAASLLLCCPTPAAETYLLRQDSIPLGAAMGRIDHLAIDTGRQHLFVAELGSNSLAVVDLEGRRVITTVSGIAEPQGVVFVPWLDAVAVTSAGDGALHLYSAEDFHALGTVTLGTDADNLLVDPERSKVIVAYGTAVAAVDATTNKKSFDIALPAHPEGLDSLGSTVFVNVPDSKQIAVIDLASAQLTASWPTGQGGANFPMAVDAEAGRAIAVFRNPPALVAFDAEDGKPLPAVAVCGDADNVFSDQIAHRLYVSCGDGHIDIFERGDDAYQLLEEIDTAPGARTSLFDAETGIFYLAVPAREGQEAAIWVYRKP